MAELKAGFYNAVMVEGVPDRTYNADEVNNFLEGLVSNSGIFATVSTACQVVSSRGMQVIVKAGKGMVDNHWFRIESDEILEIEPADVILNRIDSIIVRHSNTDRTITLEVKTGTLATNPVAPTLTRTEEVYEICLANIIVNKNITAITPSLITDTRPNNQVCGWITGLIEQIDTTTLYEQYEDAQNTFINAKTAEFSEWETEQQDIFDDWFETIKDDVRTTTLYREHSEVYSSTFAGEQDITIPTTLNYKNNSLDVLNVYINGNKLVEDIEYTISSDGTSIHLINALEVVGTPIEFVNKRSIDGTAAEEVVVQVEELESRVNNIVTYNYECNGADDNVLLSTMVKTFLDGTGNYATVEDTSQLKVIVNGTVGISELIDDQLIFDFNSTTSSKRRVLIDFANATIPRVDISSFSGLTILAGISMDDNVIVDNANIYINDSNLESTATVYGVHGGIARNCRINLDGKKEKFYGVWGANEVSNSEITINNLAYGEVTGIYETKKVLFNTIESDATRGCYVDTNSGVCMGNIGIYTDNGPLQGGFSLGNNVADIGNIIEE